VLDGTIEITVGEDLHRLGTGDCLALVLDRPMSCHNPTRKTARYAVVKALAFWRGVAESVARGERALLVAEDVDGIVGTVQLVLALPENQPHRAEVAKMLQD